MLTSLIAWIVTGFLVGLIARALMPGQQGLSFFATTLLGITGALLGGLVIWAFRGAPGEPFAADSWPGWLMSILGAILVLAIAGRANGRQLH